MEESGGIPTFRRASADKATGAACIGCHAGQTGGRRLGRPLRIHSHRAYKAASNESMERTGLTLVVTVLATMVMMYFMLRWVVIQPLQAMTLISRDIAEGEGDLTKRVPINGKDEIAELGKWFNVFIEKLQGMIGKVAHVTDKVASPRWNCRPPPKE